MSKRRPAGGDQPHDDDDEAGQPHDGLLEDADARKESDERSGEAEQRAKEGVGHDSAEVVEQVRCDAPAASTH